MTDWPKTVHYGVISSEVGRKRLSIGCGACGEKMEAYAWSLAGSGKRCPNCGALVCERNTIPKGRGSA